MTIMAIGPSIMLPPGVVEISEAFFMTIAIIALGTPIIRAIVRRADRPPAAPAIASPDTTQRLQRIEQGVEAVAIEVERIAEAQRFSAKLQAEQVKRSLPPGSDLPT